MIIIYRHLQQIRTVYCHINFIPGCVCWTMKKKLQQSSETSNLKFKVNWNRQLLSDFFWSWSYDPNLILWSSLSKFPWSSDLNIVIFCDSMIWICWFRWSKAKRSWSHDFDPRNFMIPWLWSGHFRDPTFSDQNFLWSRDYDLRISMIHRFFVFCIWILNCENLAFR